jgi:Flp pilus assembly protein TadD
VRLSEAKSELEMAVAADSQNDLAKADLGKAQGVLGNIGAAIDSLHTALALNPGLNQLHYQLAMLHRKQGRADLTDSELTEFQKNRRKNP